MEPGRQFQESMEPVSRLNALRMKTSGFDEEHIAALQGRMRQHGFPGHVQVETLNNGSLVTDGHHRLAAAERNGMTHVPVRTYPNTPTGSLAALKAINQAEREKGIS